MLLTTVSLVPVAVALVLALGLFGAWVAFLIRADRRLLALCTAEFAAAPAPLALAPPAPVVAIVASASGSGERAYRHYLVAAPDPVPAVAIDEVPEPCPVVVRSGSFCTVLGASGVTASGTEMVCSSENGARPRWRRAARQLQRTA